MIACLNLARVFSYNTLKMTEGLMMLKMILRVVCVALTLAIASMTGAHAAKVQGMQITPDIQASVDRINAYFNSFQTLRGELVQTSPRGRSAKGVFFIAKPGKLRFEVEPPTPYIMASDGKWLTLTNKTMNKGDQFPLSKTPMRLLVSSKLDILKEADVVGFEQNGGVTSIALSDKKGSLPGQIVLIFDEAQDVLQQWIIIDGKGQRTTVALANLEKDVKINPKLFQVTIKRESND
jgi:outer membrane lipoprotein-sorting protein